MKPLSYHQARVHLLDDTLKDFYWLFYFVDAALEPCPKRESTGIVVLNYPEDENLSGPFIPMLLPKNIIKKWENLI